MRNSKSTRRVNSSATSRIKLFPLNIGKTKTISPLIVSSLLPKKRQKKNKPKQNRVYLITDSQY